MYIAKLKSKQLDKEVKGLVNFVIEFTDDQGGETVELSCNSNDPMNNYPTLRDQKLDVLNADYIKKEAEDMEVARLAKSVDDFMSLTLE